MKIKFLLLGTSLSFLPTLSYAQCVATQDCEALGYTETSCNGGKGVKCPFGNKWACLEECSDCAKLGFTYECKGTGEKGVGQSCNGKYQGCSCDSTYQYTCTGTGYAGGAGSACNGKYTSCNCASGYEWTGGACQKEAQNGAVGNLYYCYGKVVGVKTSGMSFYISLTDLGRLRWSDADRVCRNYTFCGSIKGKLPDVNQLRTVSRNWSALNDLLIINGGQKFSDAYWSSTLGLKGSHLYVYLSNGHVGDYENLDNSVMFVRAVFEP